jgi:ATP-dependent protease HslVU (ClpYQ) peptidase subunit
MTTIIGVEYANRCVVLGDSRIVGDSKIYSHPDMVKVITNGNYLVGVAGDVRALQVVLHTWKPPAFLAKDRTNIFQFMVNKVAPSLKQLVTDAGLLDSKSPDKDFEINVIVGLNGNLFEIDSDFAVSRNSDGYYAIGTGGDYALGALYAGVTPEQAAEVAVINDSKTAGPFTTEIQYKK